MPSCFRCLEADAEMVLTVLLLQSSRFKRVKMKLAVMDPKLTFLSDSK
jgi:hypothetical protein